MLITGDSIVHGTGKQKSKAGSIRTGMPLRVLLLLFFVLMVSRGNAIRVEAAGPDPSQVKAAFVYNFVKFTSWPPESLPPNAAALTLCVLGHDPLGTALESLSGKAVNGKVLSVKRIKRREESSGCQMLYVCKSEEKQMDEILRGVKGGVLTIGEMKNFAFSGGIINFIMVQNRVAFEINVDAAAAGGIRFSSHLLRLAAIVKN